MGKRRIILLAASVVVAVVGGFAWLVLRIQEPGYQGKRLSEWLSGGMQGIRLDMDRTLLDSDAVRLDARANQAVRQIGTNAVPTLLRMLRAHDTRLSLKMIGLIRHQHIIRISFVPASTENLEAVVAFGCLRAAASNAVPALIQIYEERISKTSQMAAADSLVNVGPAATAAVPALLRAMGDTNLNVEVRAHAVFVLGEIHSQPELVVPALIKCLQDPEPGVQAQAVSALVSFGGDARAAVPALIDLLKYPDTRVRANAVQALNRVDPEAAKRVGIQ